MPAKVETRPAPDFNFNERCERLLSQYKRRNTKAVKRRLSGVCDVLRHEDDHVVQVKFGGSVQKGTYVTGLSDVDVLLIVNQSSLKNLPPSRVLANVRDTLRRHFPKNPIDKGRLAVTVKYADKTEIQILPAIRTTDGFRIADPGTSKWSNVVHPERFAERLIKVNNARGGRVVPTIKLAEAMADCFITRPSRKISGYHMESLAIDAFRSFEGELDPRSALVHLLGHSMKSVLNPIEDPTGQTEFVDEYLGEAGSYPRQRASTYFGQMRAKVRTASSRSDFDNLFCAGT